MQQPGIVPAALGTRRFPHQRCNGPAGEHWHAGSRSLPSREVARSVSHGLPAGHALAAWQLGVGSRRGYGLGRGAEVAGPHPSLHGTRHMVGRDGVGARQVGMGPRHCSAFSVHPTHGSRCWVQGRAACGAHPLLYLQCPGALSVGRLGACYLCPGAIESPEQMLTHTKPGKGRQRWSWGHCLGMLPAWGKADGLRGTQTAGRLGGQGMLGRGCVSEAHPPSPSPA